MVGKEVNKMKRKKAGYRLAWKAEWVKEGDKGNDKKSCCSV